MTEHQKPKMRAADAWLKKLETSNLTTQEKIDATKVLLRLWKIQDRNKVLFDTLGLGHDGHLKK
ncbi:hypothetical protein [Polynucleobacter ibericus]|uniref:hypothetical protein n=1 Tax=Polynucleobacter ibericus TaxID=1819725 RepID=UPI001BFE8999|nr:hypothetical protein [Polynucleobacter ibericus]QWE07917.1 hypothetical protein AOC20_05600 [Polynucleobacter ibericus]